MKDKTRDRLIIGTIVFLGASYALESYVKAKKRKKQIENSKIEEIEQPKDRKYFPIAKVVMDNGKVKVKKIGK